jgi:tubulin--tyrosine ligase-like protein 12
LVIQPLIIIINCFKFKVFDAGDAFQIIVEQNEDDEVQNFNVVALKDVSVDDPNNIFLVDHAWTFRLNNAREALQEVAGLKERLLESFGIKVLLFSLENKRVKCFR